MADRDHDESYDVIVVGGGGSGLAAAVSAAENGCRVLLLEKQADLGGTTGIAVGSFTASRTRLQRDAGIEDDADAHAEDAGKFAPEEIEARNDSALRRFFLSHAAETLDWLLAMGLRFHGPSPEPPNRVPRMHNVVPGAKAYIAVLQSRLLRLGGVIRCRAPVETLLRSGERVTGVRVRSRDGHLDFAARLGVILAAGDYASSAELIGEHRGGEFAAIEGINPYATGDGHRLARSVGARLLNMDVTYGPEIRFVPPPTRSFAQLLPSGGIGARVLGRLLPLVPRAILDRLIKRLLVTWQHPEDAILDDGAILVNADGERFCNERESPGREIAIARQPGKTCFILLDERLIERYSRWPHFVSTAPEIAYAYVADYLRLRPDIAVEAPSLEELAMRRRLPPTRLIATVESFNRHAAGAARDPHGRTGDGHVLRGGRWVLLGPARACFTTTEGGAAIDRELRVLDEAGRPIAGLFAVGQNGLGGQILWGHGLHIAWALTSGRLAGKVIAGRKDRV